MNNSIVPFQPAATSLVDIRLDSQNFPRIKNITQPTAISRLASVVAMAYNYTGREYTTDSVLAVASALYGELMADDFGVGTANITIEEVGRAVRRAVLGESEMYGINVSSLYKVICDYATGDGHAAQIAANNRRQKERQAALDKSAAGVMLNAYTGAMLTNTKSTTK